MMALALTIAPGARAAGAVADSSEGAAVRSELAQLRRILMDQQRQIDELKAELARQSGSVRGDRDPSAPATALIQTEPANRKTLDGPASASMDAAAASRDGLPRNIGGFRFSGDFRYRFDLQARSANDVAPALQNARSRYRLRLNIDRDLFNRDGDRSPLAVAHIQLSTAPFNNELTNDTDFAGIGSKAPFSIAEAYIDVFPFKGLGLRVGRMPEVFADNRQFIWDDDIRFNGFQETYRFARRNNMFVDFRAAQYILTNPNVQVVPAGSPYLEAGYALGQRIPSSNLFDQGVTIGRDVGERWRTDGKLGFFTVREANQIQLASTAVGQGILTNSALGVTLSSNIGATGNATVTPGGAIYAAGGFNVLHYGWNLSYLGKTWAGHNLPVTLFLQGSHNASASNYNNGYLLGATFGQAERLGDVQFQYAYFHKPANAFISQFSDDDVGTGTGVNIKDHAVRLNFGLTRWLAWENRLFVQKGIAPNHPEGNFFVPLPRGYRTTIRYQSHLAFRF